MNVTDLCFQHLLTPHLPHDDTNAGPLHHFPTLDWSSQLSDHPAVQNDLADGAVHVWDAKLIEREAAREVPPHGERVARLFRARR